MTSSGNDDLSVILGDTTGERDQFAVLAAAAESIPLPLDGHVVGEPVSVTAIALTANPRAGLRATCQRTVGRGANRRAAHFEVSLCDVHFHEELFAARVVAAYRSWLGLAPIGESLVPLRSHKVEAGEVVAGDHIELVVVAQKRSALRCRRLGTTRELTLRTGDIEAVPGTIATVEVGRAWEYARHAYASGRIVASRIDVPALGLPRLELQSLGEWDPVEDVADGDDRPIPEWLKSEIAAGARPAFEMEQVIPGFDPQSMADDPITIASERIDHGDFRGARDMLSDLLSKDLRCIDAHVHLGRIEFSTSPRIALKHYEIAVAIGDHALGQAFAGVLPWGAIDNRPFHRALHGLGLCAWRLGDSQRALTAFRRLARLDPASSHEQRSIIAVIDAGKPWRDTSPTID